MLDTGRLDRITTFPALIDYLRDELDWPIAEDDFEQLTFEYTPEEVGLDSAKVGGGIEIKQLRPLTREQPWGIFFVNLPKKQLSATVLRALLGSLAPRKRASTNPAERAAFAREDLMFIASTGDADHRHIDFAHFRAPAEGQKTAPLQVLGWDTDDTERRIHLTSAMLRDKLRWPEAGESVAQWRQRWSEAFREPPRYSITQSLALAQEMARLAKRIRARVAELIEVETENGALRRLYAGFKEALIHDLTPEKFADYYAQTITYGLFSARVSRPSMGFGHDSIHLNVAGTSPFLKEMLAQFLEAGGRKAGSGGDYVDFDTLGVSDVVAMLDAADMDSVLADWGHRKQDEDPVVHFYQDFLDLYDPGEKKKRGVFYTPQPVVSFIVRSVDEVLRTDFGLKDGLASTETWEEVITAKPEIKLPEGAKQTDLFVRVLDPATGTGTFLVESIKLIHRTMVAKWKKAGKRDAEITALWNDYVPKYLLPRLYGFELMMAPYAIAHVKIGLTLADTGYSFGSDERARIYLTNALEPAQDFDMQLAFMSKALAHEAQAANRAKDVRFTVVFGNPPYSKISSNLGENAVAWVEPFRFVAGEKIKERGALAFEMAIQDDYVKFWGFAYAMIRRSGSGVASYISNFRYLDGTYLRGLRYAFLQEFPCARICNLGGQIAEQAHIDGDDENVFDIEQGTGIGLYSTRSGSGESDRSYSRLTGTRQHKYDVLLSPGALTWESLRPRPDSYLFVTGFDDPTGDPDWPRLDTILPFNSGSIITSRDSLLINKDAELLKTRITAFGSSKAGDKSIFNELGFSAKASWDIEAAKASVRHAQKEKAVDSYIKRLAYRPFDNQFIYYDVKLIDTPSKPVSTALYSTKNLALLSPKVKTSGRFTHVFVADVPGEKKVASHDRATQMFALYKAPTDLQPSPVPTFSSKFISGFSAAVGLTWDDCVEAPRQTQLNGIVAKKPTQTAMFARRRERGDLEKTFGPRDVFDWIYAVLHSPTYRSRYADYLKSEFARIPLPGTKPLFRELVPLGTKLVALHLLDIEGASELKDPQSVRFAGYGEAQVEKKPEWSAAGGNRVSISRHRWFEGVPERVWNFHIGGYQPAEKWLKDRAAKGGKKKSAGRVLTAEDQLHYRRMIAAMDKTIEVMAEVDRVIEKHGGWPMAFSGISS
jgi:hypothetical protein